MKKRKLRPWVKTAAAFIFGVIVVANITSAFNAFADGDAADSGEMMTVYGIVTVNLDGYAHIQTIDGAFEYDIVLPLQEEYVPMEMVKVSLLGSKVIGHELANEREESAVIEAEKGLVEDIRESVFRATFVSSN